MNTAKKPSMKPLPLTPPKPGTMSRLAEDLFWMRFTLPFRLDHINLYAFDTNEGWLLLDCGINSHDIAKQWTKMLNGPLSKKPVCGIIVSHYHADHVGYAGALAALTGAPVYMGEVEHSQATWSLAQSDYQYGTLLGDTYTQFGLPKRIVEQARAQGNYYRRLSGDLPPVRSFGVNDKFLTKMGCWIPRFDRGHSPGHLSLFDPDRKIHICVDFLLPRISPNISVSLREIEVDMLGHYYAYLKQMRDLEDDWLIIPGHDWPYYGGGIRASELIEHHNSRLQLLRASAKNNRLITTADAIQTLFSFKLNDHELFFASCEARAHLNHLVALQEMNVSQEKGVDIFQLS